MLLDQTALGPSWWCYAVQSWISTANSTTWNGEDSKCAYEQVTGKLELLDSKFLFPFGCPVTCTKVDGRALHYDTINEFGIAIGSSTGSNRATLVILPGKGLKPFERLHVRPLTIDTPQGATTGVLNLEHLAPTFNDDGIQATFQCRCSHRPRRRQRHPRGKTRNTRLVHVRNPKRHHNCLTD